ncbi:MAG: hypothetical protein WC464_09410 [Bdellovibrionales bacterium]
MNNNINASPLKALSYTLKPEANLPAIEAQFLKLVNDIVSDADIARTKENIRTIVKQYKNAKKENAGNNGKALVFLMQTVLHELPAKMEPKREIIRQNLSEICVPLSPGQGNN